LEKELAINPGNGMAYFNLGEAYCQLSKWEQALLPIRKAIWLEPYFSSSYILLGKIYFQKKDLSSSVTVLKQAIQLDPNSKSAHYDLGKTSEQLGRAIEAKQEFLTSENLPGIVQWQ
jgi:tetratricopeptide (TPR) repeat protein